MKYPKLDTLLRAKGVLILTSQEAESLEIARVAVCAAFGEDMMGSDSVACDREVTTVKREARLGRGQAYFENSSVLQN